MYTFFFGFKKETKNHPPTSISSIYVLKFRNSLSQLKEGKKIRGPQILGSIVSSLLIVFQPAAAASRPTRRPTPKLPTGFGMA